MRLFDFLDHDSFTDFYKEILGDLLNRCDYVISPRGMKINEIVNATVHVDPRDHTIDFTKTGAPERQEAYDRYRKAEIDWYLSCNTLAASAPSKFWNQLANPEGHITSNYGHMMLKDTIYPAKQPHEWPTSKLDGTWDGQAIQFFGENQTAIDRVVQTLKNDVDSRQAIAHYNQPKHCYPDNKDFPCTVYSQFFVRNGYLNMTTYQRSCDIIKGFSYDVPWNCHFMQMVRDRLAKEGLDVKMGEFTHVFGSLHLYHKDLELAEKIVQQETQA